jgi:hypothetical protein
VNGVAVVPRAARGVRAWARAAVPVAVVFMLLAIAALFLQARGGAFDRELAGYPDEAAHNVTALMLHDIKPENLETAVQYTLENGVYSQGHGGRPRGKSQPQNIPQGKRVPNTVRPWEEESKGYRCLSGDIEFVKSKWQANDAAAYNYIWTTVLW